MSLLYDLSQSEQQKLKYFTTTKFHHGAANVGTASELKIMHTNEVLVYIVASNY
jgi:hypothetical protein